MTRSTDKPPAWVAALRYLGRPDIAAMLLACILSLGLSSAFAGSDSRLAQIGYREALNWFHSQKYDSAGVWLCG